VAQASVEGYDLHRFHPGNAAWGAKTAITFFRYVMTQMETALQWVQLNY
jgi:hypothetical protein